MQNGVLLLILAMSLTPGIDGLAKQMSAEHSPFQVSFFRYFAAGCVAVIISRIIDKPIRVPRRGRIGHVVRTGLLVSAMTCLIFALSMVPMANAVGGFLVAPIVSTVLCVAFFGERLTAPRATGAAVSLVGAVLISRPEAALEPGSLLALAGGALLGAYLAATRVAEDTGGTLSTLAVQCLLGSALIAPFAFRGGLPDLSLTLLAYTVGLGVMSAGAHFLTVAAFERTDAGILSPFMYFNLIAALIVGYLWFGEMPGSAELLGLAAIALGGVIAALPASARRRLVRRWRRNAPSEDKESEFLVTKPAS